MKRLCERSKWMPILKKHDKDTGFSLPMLEWGFDHVFSHLSDTSELGLFCKNEIPGFHADDLADFINLDCHIQRRQQIIGRNCCQKIYIVSASTVPSAAFQDLILILLLPAEVILRPAQNLLGLFRDIWQLLNDEAPEIARRLTIVDTGHDVSQNIAWISQCDAVIVSGSDETIQMYESMIPPHLPAPLFVRYGHRISAGILKKDEINHLEAEDYDHIALDCSVWDQMGCLSPRFLFIESEVQDCIRIGEYIIESLNTIGGKIPSFSPEISMSAARNMALRMSLLDGCKVIHGTHMDTVVVHRTLSLDHALMYERTLNIFPVKDAFEAAMLLSPRGQGLGFLNLPDEATRQKLSTAGYNYFCTFGKMQDPPLTWLHNGIGTVRPLILSEKPGDKG